MQKKTWCFDAENIYAKKSIQNTRVFPEIVYILEQLFCIYIFGSKIVKKGAEKILSEAIFFYIPEGVKKKYKECQAE